MKTFLLDIINRIKLYSDNRNVEYELCDKVWYVFNDENIKELYIFHTDNSVYITSNGIGIEGTWEWEDINNTLIIKNNGKIMMLHPEYIDNNILALNLDGTSEHAFLIEEKNRDNFKPKTLSQLNNYFNEKIELYIEEQTRVARLRFEEQLRREKEQREEQERLEQERLYEIELRAEEAKCALEEEKERMRKEAERKRQEQIKQNAESLREKLGLYDLINKIALSLTLISVIVGDIIFYSKEIHKPVFTILLHPIKYFNGGELLVSLTFGLLIFIICFFVYCVIIGQLLSGILYHFRKKVWIKNHPNDERIKYL